MSILAVHSGTYGHIECLEEPRYSGYFDKLARPEDLAGIGINDFNVVVVPCGTPAHRIIPHKQLLLDYLNQGGTIIVTGDSNYELWLPGIKQTRHDADFTWWLDKDADLGVKVAKPEHSLFKYIGKREMTWHLHGWYDVPEGAEVLAVNKEGKPFLYIDEVTTKGKMVITSLDAFAHHGMKFMPMTTAFLDGFLPWMRDHLDK